MHYFGTVVRLSLCDYFHERLLSVCAVLGLAAVLAPLLVLFGVKSGIINTMADRLIEDPLNREISSVGSGHYEKDWFLSMGKHPDVAFVIPQTRSIAANMVLYNRKGGQTNTVAVDLIPTMEGDPLLEKWGSIPADDTSVTLTQSAARRLGVSIGQEVTGLVGRSVKGIKEQVAIKFKVSSILPIEALPRRAAFVRLKLLEATEDYRDGFGSAAFAWPGKARRAGPRAYAGFRMYARSIYGVAALRDLLMDQGVEVYTRAEEIEVIRTLDRAFGLIFKLIAIVAVFGYFASMASNVLANVNRKSRHLGVIRLIGFSTGSMIWFPIVQSIATSILGSVTAFCFYLIAEIMINRLFDQYLADGEYICRLSFVHMLFALALTLLMSILASVYAAYRVARIEPSQVIRDV